MPGLFHISEEHDQLYSTEQRQLRIALRKRGYKGDLDLRSMKKFLDRTKQKIVFTSYHFGPLVCEMEFAPCHEKMALHA